VIALCRKCAGPARPDRSSGPAIRSTCRTPPPTSPTTTRYFRLDAQVPDGIGHPLLWSVSRLLLPLDPIPLLRSAPGASRRWAPVGVRLYLSFRDGHEPGAHVYMLPCAAGSNYVGSARLGWNDDGLQEAQSVAMRLHDSKRLPVCCLVGPGLPPHIPSQWHSNGNPGWSRQRRKR